MFKLDREEEESIQYIVAIAMLIFGMVLCLLGFFTPPVGEIHTSVLAVLGQILILVGAIFHLNISYKNKEQHFESLFEKRLEKLGNKDK